MAVTQIEFIKLCASTINSINPFDGDPLKLNPFINSFNLITPLADTVALRQTLVNFIKTKLSGKALEALPDNANTTEQIIQSLQNSIKHDSSKIVEGKLLALRLDRTTLNEFTQQINTLADSYRRGLISEVFPAVNANNLTIQKTIEVCRANAKSDIIKAVLASSQFNDHKEVIFFDKLYDVLNRNTNFSNRSRIYNLDETSTITVQKHQKVLAEKGTR